MKDTSLKRARKMLRENLESPGTGCVVFRGPLGIGKSFVCKEIIAKEFCKNRMEGLAVFWGWEEFTSATPRREVEFLVVSQRGRSGWVEVQEASLQDSAWIEWTPNILLSPPRQLAAAGGVIDHFLDKSALCLVIDKYDTFTRDYLDQRDWDVLQDWREKGAFIVLEVRDPAFVTLSVERNIPLQLPLGNRVELVNLERKEATAIAESVWQKGLGAYGEALEGMEDRLNRILLSAAGRHPGTLVKVIGVLGARLTEGRRRTFEEIISSISSIKVHEVRKYFAVRWSELRDREKQVIGLIAIGEEQGKNNKSILDVWTRKLGGADSTAVGWRDSLEKLSLERGFIVSEHGEFHVDGWLLRDWVLALPEVNSIREEMGFRAKDRSNFRWDRFLFWWLFSVSLYFVVSVASWASRWEPDWFFWIGCWSPALGYLLICLARWGLYRK